MSEDQHKNAANYFMTMAFLTGIPDHFFYDLEGREEERLPLPIRAFLTEWRRHAGCARPEWCPPLRDDSDAGDLFNTIDYCIDQILRRIVPRYERIERRRRQRHRRSQRRRRQPAAQDRGDIQTPTKEVTR